MNFPTINKTDVAKFVAGSVVGTGVGFISKEIIANNVNLPEGRYQKIAVIAGSVVIGMMAKDASKTYTSTKIDETIAAFTGTVTQIKDAQTETPATEQ